MRQLLVAAAVCSLIASPAHSDDASEYTDPDSFVADCVSYRMQRSMESAVSLSRTCRVDYYAYVVSDLGKPLPEDFDDVCSAMMYRGLVSDLRKDGISPTSDELDIVREESVSFCVTVKEAILDGTYWQ